MKMCLYSDIHLEFGSYTPKISDGVEVVVIAGDTKPGGNLAPWINSWLPEGVHVVVIPGNHEGYHWPIEAAIANIERLNQENPFIHGLHNSTWTYKNVRFIGTTLWTDFMLDGNPDLSMMSARMCMNDFLKISYKNNILDPRDTVEFHTISKQFIGEELSKPWDGKTVVVTHHGPSGQSISKDYARSKINGAYVSELGYWLLGFEDKAPDYWFHGHVHNSFDYTIGKTHVITNPRGYNGENRQFDGKKVIEL